MKHEPSPHKPDRNPGKLGQPGPIGRPRSNAGCFILVLVVGAIVGWYFWKGKPVVYRLLHPNFEKAEPAPIKEPVIPGIDVAPKSDDDK